MADATVSRPRHEESLSAPVDRDDGIVAGAPPRRTRPLLILWTALVVLLGAFLLIGSVRIGAGNWIGRRMSVPEIWSRFLDYLADQGASPAIVALVVITAAITVIGGAGLVLVAFGVRDVDAHQGRDNPDR